MLAVWRVHRVDQIMRRAWQAGVVLSGVSAGAICWFSGGTTDSFGADLRPFADGLGMFAPSYCPHYDSERQRRPLYQSLVAGGTLAPGIACDDGAAAHFVDDELAGIVTDAASSRGYFVDRAADGSAVETVLEVERLTR
jgi:peptidase E